MVTAPTSYAGLVTRAGIKKGKITQAGSLLWGVADSDR